MLFQNPLPLPTVFIRRERITDLLDFGNSGLEDFNFFLDLLFKNATSRKVIFGYLDHATSAFRKLQPVRPVMERSVIQRNAKALEEKKEAYMRSFMPDVFKELN